MNVQEQIERTRQVIHRHFSEVWNEGRLQVLDELLTPDYINHSPSTQDPERDPRGLKPIVAAMRVGIPICTTPCSMLYWSQTRQQSTCV
jgi:predicted SnoaL-like aldol condensation-catalyzing enzyme